MNTENNFNTQGTNGIPNNQPLQNNQDIQPTNISSNTPLNQKNKKKGIIILIISLVIALIAGVILFTVLNNDSDDNNEIKQEEKKSPYWISGNSLEAFDLYFLQLQNTKENKVFSPLSIKTALKMLEEGATGESKSQIASVIGDYKANKYTNSKNMSFANAFFIKDTFKDSINEEYSKTLSSKYNADVKTDSFATPDVVNNWVSDKTLGIINNLMQDISSYDFLLVNALAIDMEWEEKFPIASSYVRYEHEEFSWLIPYFISKKDFKNSQDGVSGLDFIASFNNYDIVNELGEENIRNTVKAELIKYLNEYPDYEFSKDFFDETGSIKEDAINKYLDNYIKEINSNYKREDISTDFLLYVDNDVKAFAKDLKEYDGTTLQYVAIMPTNEELETYIEKTNSDDINNIINNLKELKADNFKDGVVTRITGFIPKFKFEYELNLIDNLNKLGITNVFEQGKANLTNLSSNKSAFIDNISHKATIELTQDGIKASALTMAGGLGAAGAFDYIYDVPVEEIDLSFDKPFMFIIRDKESGEVWFTGTVYQPLLFNDDATVDPAKKLYN